MISKIEKKDVSVSLKVYKNAYRICVPFVVLITVICGIFSLFESAEGSNAKTSASVLFWVGVVLLVAATVVDKVLAKDEAYFDYTPALAEKLGFSKLVPLIAFVVVVFVPFYIQAITSVKTSAEANQVDFTWFPKDGFTLESYRQVFFVGDIIGITMFEAFINSVVYAVIPTVVGIFVSALSAYGFAKLDFFGKKFIYTFLIFTIMLPSCITMSSTFVLFDNIGWVDTPLPLIVPGCFGTVTCVFFHKEYFAGIPNELLEAANIDGAGKIGRFFSIVLPTGVPALIAQFILIFISRYNDFTGPLIYLSSPEKYTVQIALNFFSGSARDKDILSAASMVAVLPMFALYIVFQKKILNGISMSSGLKG